MKISLPGLGNRLRRARNETGLSQEKVAREIGVSWMSVHRWERSQRAISDHLLNKLCSLYKISLVWFLTLEEGDLDEGLEPRAVTGNGHNKVSKRVARAINEASEEELSVAEDVLASLLESLRKRN